MSAERRPATILALQAAGCTAFVVGSAVAGAWLRRHPSKQAAEWSSRVLHLLFWLGLGLPGMLGALRPGLSRYDGVLSIPSLPFRPLARVLSVPLLVVGAYLLVVSSRALRLVGQGANAFVLTRRLVDADIYQRTRNPMSLGFYLLCLGVGLAAGSTYVTVGSLLATIPGHLFFLKYFEELELKLRFGDSYAQYMKTVPFLIPRFASTPPGGSIEDRDAGPGWEEG